MGTAAHSGSLLEIGVGSAGTVIWGPCCRLPGVTVAVRQASARRWRIRGRCAGDVIAAREEVGLREAGVRTGRQPSRGVRNQSPVQGRGSLCSDSPRVLRVPHVLGTALLQGRKGRHHRPGGCRDSESNGEWWIYRGTPGGM